MWSYYTIMWSTVDVQGPVQYNTVLEKLLPDEWDISSLQGATIFVHNEVNIYILYIYDSL